MKIKRILTCIMLVLIMCTAMFGTAAMAAGDDSGTGVVSPMAEQTQWYFRVNSEGMLEKRLWSLTYGVWLTDWMPA